MRDEVLCAAIEPGAFTLGDVHGSGPALLCLHGLTGMPLDVRPPDAVVEELGIACVGPLLPGHGTSVEQLSRTGRQQWLQTVLDTYDQLARTHSRVYVLGLSLGGLLALHLCTVRPIHAALVLAAPLDLGFFRRNLVRLAVPFVPAIPRTPGVWDPQARARDVGYKQMPLRAVMELMDLQRALVASLASVTAPVRLLYSRRDSTVHLRDAARIADSVGSSDVRVQYLEHSGHILTMDLERDRVAAWITDQLAELEALALRG